MEMPTRESVKYRAVMMGIATGDMPEVELIWATQFAEGCAECFGRGRACRNVGCQWRHHCLALELYADPTDRAVMPDTRLADVMASNKASQLDH